MPVVTPAARAFLAWQLAAHWGNRQLARPRPRAEVVSAALLARLGFDAVGSDIGPVGPAPEAPSPDLARRRSAVGRAAHLSRYAALLLALHFAEAAEGLASDLAAARPFRDEMARWAAEWREALAADARYEQVLSGPGLAANLALLAAWQAVADGLASSSQAPFAVRAPARTGPPVEVTLKPLGDRRWRVRPWPLQGERLQLQCEVRRAEVDDGGAGGSVERVTFTLMRSAARG